MPSYEQNRGSARARGYNTRWQTASNTFKQRHPYCLGCQAIGKQVKADLVDHVEPHKGSTAKFWTTSLWQPSCRWHHDVIKQQLERKYEAGEITLADLWLNSKVAIALSRRQPAPPTIGSDGWSIG